MSESQFELLAPGGDIESIKAAIAAGADAVYCGLERFNARNRASNLNLDDLKAILVIAHEHHCKIFLTLNIILLESEIRSVVRLLNQLIHTDIDGVIIQDLGLGYILKHYFPMLDVHGSTQLNSHNEGQIRFLSKLGTSRVNLSRELDSTEIRHLTQYGRQHNVLMEVFVHGSYCIGFSGLCYISSARNGASGNRGRCSQPCRDKYQTTDMGISHPLNMKDNTAFEDFAELAELGVYSLKVEGRMKQPHYVFNVVDQWRQQIDRYENNQPLLSDTSELYKVFNRDFSAGYLKGTISKEMYIDNPRNHSADHFIQQAGVSEGEQTRQIKQQVYDENTRIIARVNERLVQLDHEQHKNQTTEKKYADIQVPAINTDLDEPIKPHLNVLVSTLEEVQQLHADNISVYYQMPSSLARQKTQVLDVFSQYPHLIPWFPAVLIGDNYLAAQQFLEAVKPSWIVTNNTGIGMLAGEMDIAWLAGPQLNLTNSYALQCLQQEYGCSGAFISNEISHKQMKRIVRPKGFRLCHSIYHPMNLLTSRQCLFQQTVGCKKKRVTRGCLPNCKKSASILNLNGSAYVIDKQLGEHNSLYNQHHFMNLEVIQDLPELFTDWFIDVRDIHTETRSPWRLNELVEQFRQLCEKEQRQAAILSLQNAILPTTHAQYHKGL
ncbi:U32 family peptidase [Vibrio nitrifigilis]|uniref:U32 family peptidase n=1 Tax=Vibrio nitrifigilis TaxID=2789781 RepID=A0ABS0GM22_9VIBR|nr:peptidase U32 family protein [Vibrio nitrifigilis]MBF9003274.1 U32 family peptidase [Vibrio nitrifigilis]